VGGKGAGKSSRGRPTAKTRESAFRLLGSHGRDRRGEARVVVQREGCKNRDLLDGYLTSFSRRSIRHSWTGHQVGEGRPAGVPRKKKNDPKVKKKVSEKEAGKGCKDSRKRNTSRRNGRSFVLSVPGSDDVKESPKKGGVKNHTERTRLKGGTATGGHHP